jgi:hypothetical protein
MLTGPKRKNAMTKARVVFLDEGGNEIKTVLMAGLVVTPQANGETESCTTLEELIKCLAGKENQTLKVAGTITEVV